MDGLRKYKYRCKYWKKHHIYLYIQHIISFIYLFIYLTKQDILLWKRSYFIMYRFVINIASYVSFVVS